MAYKLEEMDKQEVTKLKLINNERMSGSRPPVVQ